MDIPTSETDLYEANIYTLNIASASAWNQLADEAIIPILPGLNGSGLPRLDQLNYKISSLRDCPSNTAQGSPVTIIGFPLFAALPDSTNGSIIARTVTNGVISGYDNGISGLPYSNYFVSATIDSGNSGGIALSKDANGLCLLGIPTWITMTGKYSNEGIVQNINNIMYSQ